MKQVQTLLHIQVVEGTVLGDSIGSEWREGSYRPKSLRKE